MLPGRFPRQLTALTAPDRCGKISTLACTYQRLSHIQTSAGCDRLLQIDKEPAFMLQSGDKHV